MIVIVTTTFPRKKCSRFPLLPYHIRKDVLGAEPVLIYSLKTCFRPLYQFILNQLLKKYPNLIVSDELCADRKSVGPVFFKRIKEILPLLHKNEPLKIAVLCQQETPHLFPLLKAVSPFSRSVSLLTEDARFSDRICEEAIRELGLTVNQRTIPQLQNPDLIFFLSGEFDLPRFPNGYVINLSEQEKISNLPTLSALTCDEISAFFSRHPDLKINPTRLLSETMPVTGLIWKYS